jgi:hypothetical protein
VSATAVIHNLYVGSNRLLLLYRSASSLLDVGPEMVTVSCQMKRLGLTIELAVVAVFLDGRITSSGFGWWWFGRGSKGKSG